MSETSNNSPKLLTVNQFVEAHPFMTSGGMRFILFNASTNGLKEKKVIKRLGRKILIDETAFFEWLNEKNEVNHA